jgi:hypothetical protein
MARTWVCVEDLSAGERCAEELAEMVGLDVVAS